MKRTVLVLFLAILCATSLSGRAYSQSPDKKYAVILNESVLQDESVGAAWMAYGLKRVLWLKGDFVKNFPKEKEYRYTFQEEVDARGTLAQVWIELQQADPSRKDKYLDELALVHKNNFMKEYVAVYLKRPGWKIDNSLKLDDFKKWAKANIPGHKALTLADVKPAEGQSGPNVYIP